MLILRLFLFSLILLLIAITGPCSASDISSLPSLPSLPTGDDGSAVGGDAAARLPEDTAGESSFREDYKGTVEKATSQEGFKANKSKIAYGLKGGKIDARIDDNRPLGKAIRSPGEGRPKPSPSKEGEANPRPVMADKLKTNQILKNR
jgi:hypothetical protein